MNDYPEGSTVRLSGKFYADNEVMDPTTLTLIVEGRRNLELKKNDVVKEADGIYHYDLVSLEPGKYAYYWRGYGSLVAFEGNFFMVSEFKMNL